ncbi:hypothetical protein JOQ06_005855, partial [Pogonophryne albipinna]
LPIEEHGKGGKPSLFIPNVRSRYSGGSEPGWRKEQHAGQEQRGLNQTSLVNLSSSCQPAIYTQ